MNSESKIKWILGIKKLSEAIYLIMTLALIQALFAVTAYVATNRHNLEMVLIIRILSVAFLVVGLVVLGWNTRGQNVSLKVCIFEALCVSIPTASLIFAIKGLFVFVIASSLNPETSILTNFFNYRDILIYFLPSLILLVATGAIRTPNLKHNKS